MRVGRSLVVGAAVALGAVVGAPRAAAAQQVTARFEIVEVADTTFKFSMGPQRWVAQRNRGIVVDPARRDMLVARFRIAAVQGDTVIAVVTGQTTRVTIEHFVVMNPPPPPKWYKGRGFWTGIGLGGVAGLLLGGALF